MPWWVLVLSIITRLFFSKPDLKEKVCNKVDQINADKGLDKSIAVEDIYREFVLKSFLSEQNNLQRYAKANNIEYKQYLNLLKDNVPFLYVIRFFPFLKLIIIVSWFSGLIFVLLQYNTVILFWYLSSLTLLSIVCLFIKENY